MEHSLLRHYSVWQFPLLLVVACGLFVASVYSLIASSAVVREGGFVVVGSYFGHCFVTCPNSLHLQQFGWSVVTNTQYWISSHVTTKDRGIFYILVV